MQAFLRARPGGMQHAAKETRRIKTSTLALDPREPVLVVSCVVERATVGPDGRPSFEQAPQQARLKAHAPEDYDACVRMAEELVASSERLVKSQQSEIEQLLHQLHQRALVQREHEESLIMAAKPTCGEAASMDELETYLEPLYDIEHDAASDAAKVHGTAMVLELMRDPAHLEPLVQNQALLGVLSRLLADHAGSCSPAIVYNIMRVFLVFSNFYEMHQILTEHRVGSLTMRVLEAELQRTAAATITAQPPPRPQPRLLFVCVYLLLNLASNLETEEKMVRRRLVPLLLPLLGHSDMDLALLAATFCCKLSHYEENIVEVRAGGIVRLLLPWLPAGHDTMTEAALGLALNLAFDAQLRAEMVGQGIVPKLVVLLKRPAFRARTLQLLYQLSVGREGRAALATDPLLIPLVMDLVLGFPKSRLPPELAALAVNLTSEPRAAEAVCQKAGLRRLMDRLLRHGDPLVMKVIRNVGQWTLGVQAALEDPDGNYSLRSLWPSHVRPLLHLAVDPKAPPDLLVEVVGTLANLTPLDLPIGTGWRDLLVDERCPLLDLCRRTLGDKAMEATDLVLEVVLLLQALALEAATAADLARGGFVRTLHATWQRHQAAEPEVALQVLVAVERLLHHPEPLAAVMADEAFAFDVAAAVGHGNEAVREAAQACVAIMVEADRGEDGELGERGLRLREQQFEAHNRAWQEE